MQTNLIKKLRIGGLGNVSKFDQIKQIEDRRIRTSILWLTHSNVQSLAEKVHVASCKRPLTNNNFEKCNILKNAIN